MASWMTPNERDLYRIYQAWRNAPGQPISQVLQQLGSKITPENFSHGMRRLATRAQSIQGWTQQSVRMAEAGRMARAGQALSTVSQFSLRTAAANGVRAAATFLGPAGIITLGSLLLIGAVGLHLYWQNQHRMHTGDSHVSNPDPRLGGGSTHDDPSQRNLVGNVGGSDRNERPTFGIGGSGSRSNSSRSGVKFVSVPRGVGVTEKLRRPKPKPSAVTAVGADGIRRREIWEQEITQMMTLRQFDGEWKGNYLFPKMVVHQSGRTFRGHVWITTSQTETHYVTRKVPVQGTVSFRGSAPVAATLDLGFTRGALEISRRGTLAIGEIDGQTAILSNVAGQAEREQLAKRNPFRH